MQVWVRRAGESLAAVAIVCALAWAAHTVWVPVRVAGMSMRPALTAGDLVLVRTDLRPGPGAIALVREPGHAAMLHRVIAVQGDGSCRTRGDANPVDDIAPAAASSVRGTVVLIAPVGALIQRWHHHDAVR